MTGMSCGDACAHRPNGSTRALRTISNRARANHDPPMISSCSEGQCSGSVLDGTRRSPELDETRLVRVQIQSESRNPPFVDIHQFITPSADCADASQFHCDSGFARITASEASLRAAMAIGLAICASVMPSSGPPAALCKAQLGPADLRPWT